MPIPFFNYKNENKILINDEIIDHLLNLFEEHSIEIWWTWSIEDLLPYKYKDQAKLLEKGKENFENWFDSSLISDYIIKNNSDNDNLNTESMERNKNYNKTLKKILTNEFAEEDFRLNIPKVDLIEKFNNLTTNLSSQQTFDITIENKLNHDFFFLYSSITNFLLRGQVPFNNITTLGNILNSTGIKLNSFAKIFIDLLDITDGTFKSSGERSFGYGADALRLYFCLNFDDKDTKLIEEDLEECKKHIKELRKIAKQSLILLNGLKDFNLEKQNLNFENLQIFEQIVLIQFFKFYSASLEDLKEFQISNYINNLIDFTTQTFSDFYISSLSNSNSDSDSLDKKQKSVLFFLIKNLILLYSPVLPFNCYNIFNSISNNFSDFNNKKEDVFSLVLEKPDKLKKEFQYKYNEDFDFNGENLLKIKQIFLNQIKFLNLKIKKQKLIVILDVNKDSYEYLLLKSIGSNLKNCFNAALCLINKKDLEFEDFQCLIENSLIEFTTSKHLIH